MVPKDPRESFAALNGEEQMDSTIQPTLLAGEAKHSAEASTKGKLSGNNHEPSRRTYRKMHGSIALLLAADGSREDMCGSFIRLSEVRWRTRAAGAELSVPEAATVRAFTGSSCL